MAEPSDDRLTELAVEFGIARRAVGRCRSTCAALRCMQALQADNPERALVYANLAVERSVRWVTFATMVRTTVEARRDLVPPRIC